MIDPSNVPPVEETEWLARYVISKKHYRKDLTIKPDPFIPYRHRELSVTRHREATESELWTVGVDVASQQSKTLRGRADIKAKDCMIDSLRVIAKPQLPQNPNHVDIEGWPPSKQDQKVIALKLAAFASSLKIPPVSFTQSED